MYTYTDRRIFNPLVQFNIPVHCVIVFELFDNFFEFTVSFAILSSISYCYFNPLISNNNVLLIAGLSGNYFLNLLAFLLTC